MIDTELHIDDLDGAVTLFKSTDEGTETIAVFDEEHRKVIQDLLAEVERLREKLESIQNNMAWTVQVWWNENYMGREGWMEQMCEVYADLAKGIEAQYHGEEEE
tara:strand:- start:627 stop:938 length:312 start_codon:yes stop_codon:yes gene_type:complete